MSRSKQATKPFTCQCRQSYETGKYYLIIRIKDIKLRSAETKDKGFILSASADIRATYAKDGAVMALEKFKALRGIIFRKANAEVCENGKGESTDDSI